MDEAIKDILNYVLLGCTIVTLILGIVSVAIASNYSKAMEFAKLSLLPIIIFTILYGYS